MVIADQAPFHQASVVHQWVRAHRTQIRLFFFPPHAPELNPDEPVWNELKQHQLGQQPIQDKTDLKKRIRSILKSL
jgi:transposase